MALKTVTGTAECPECFAEIELKNVMKNEITQCPDCGADLEVVNIEPLELALAGEGARLQEPDGHGSAGDADRGVV